MLAKNCNTSAKNPSKIISAWLHAYLQGSSVLPVFVISNSLAITCSLDRACRVWRTGMHFASLIFDMVSITRLANVYTGTAGAAHLLTNLSQYVNIIRHREFCIFKYYVTTLRITSNISDHLHTYSMQVLADYFELPCLMLHLSHATREKTFTQLSSVRLVHWSCSSSNLIVAVHRFCDIYVFLDYRDFCVN